MNNLKSKSVPPRYNESSSTATRRATARVTLGVSAQGPD